MLRGLDPIEPRWVRCARLARCARFVAMLLRANISSCEVLDFGVLTADC